MPAAARSAWLNSQLPISIAIDTMAMNQCRSISSDARIAAPSSTPTPMAAGRLRPARDGFRPADSCAESFTSITRAERSESNGCRGTSDLEQLGFLALDQLVDLLDVLVGQRLQLLLGVVDVVLADLALLLQPLELFLGLAPQTTDDDLGVLTLALGDLDHFAAAFLGQLREHHANDRAVVRSEEHTSELQSRENLVCRLLLE